MVLWKWQDKCLLLDSSVAKRVIIQAIKGTVKLNFLPGSLFLKQDPPIREIVSSILQTRSLFWETGDANFFEFLTVWSQNWQFCQQIFKI